jgi:hypothetical protein
MFFSRIFPTAVADKLPLNRLKSCFFHPKNTLSPDGDFDHFLPESFDKI